MISIPPAAYNPLCSVPLAYEDNSPNRRFSAQTKGSVLLGYDETATGQNRIGEQWAVIVPVADFPEHYRVKKGAVVIPDHRCVEAATMPEKFVVQEAILLGAFWHLTCSAKEKPPRNG